MKYDLQYRSQKLASLSVLLFDQPTPLLPHIHLLVEMSEVDLEATPSDANLLPTTETEVKLYLPPNSRQVLRIALNLKKLIDQIIPVEVSSAELPNILTPRVVLLAYEACGGQGNGEENTSSRKYRACVLFCLLTVTNWYGQLSELNLHDSEIYLSRYNACEQLGKYIIESQKDETYLFIQMLCRRYSIYLHDEDTVPVSALELAVDRHSITIISSSGYQRCMKWLWRGWIVQSARDPQSYVIYEEVAKSKISAHFSPNRLKTPMYQNYIEIFISVLYLILFTYVLNTHDSFHPDGLEYLYYLFTIGFALDEIIKFYHVGINYLRFWNAFNDTMYSLILVSFAFRIVATTKPKGSDIRFYYGEISYKILSCSAPFMWTRLLLYLDTQRFVGAMIVVIQKMMKESILFFVLLFIIIIGFLQGFLGLDSADGTRDKTKILLHSMVKTIIGGSDFAAFEKLAPPYSGILYYAFVFIITVILLNILGALFNSSYSVIIAHSTEEYLALSASKTLRYIRSPDEDLFIPPFNLVEFLCLTLPFSGWVPRRLFKRVNYIILLCLYAPFLIFTSIFEIRNARRVQYNRFKGLPDDANEIDTEWDLEDGYEDNLQNGVLAVSGVSSTTRAIKANLEAQKIAEREDPEFSIDLNKFNKKVKQLAPPVKEGNELGVSWEIYELHEKLDKLTSLVRELTEATPNSKAKLSST